MIVKQKAKSGCCGCYYINNCPVDKEIEKLDNSNPTKFVQAVHDIVSNAECSVEDYIWVDKQPEQYT